MSTGDEADLKGILRDAPVPILVVGAGGNILFGNSKAESLLGRYPDDIRGFVRDSAVSCNRSAGGAMPPTEAPGLRMALVEEDGRAFDVEMTTSPGIYRGEPVTIAVIREVPPQGAVRPSAEGAPQTGGTKDNRHRLQLAIASHEFRVPLGIIDSAAQRLARILAPEGTGDAARRVRQIRRSVKGLLRLIEDTIDGDLSARALRIQETDLAAMLAQICQDQAELSEDRPIVCAFEPLPLMQVDPALIERVFINLLSNAIKFSSEEFPVWVSATHDATHVVIDVADQGIGIPEAELGKVFDACFRASNADHAPGSGLGLGIVRRLVEAHKGTVQIRSTRGLGTVVTVRMPIVAESD